MTDVLKQFTALARAKNEARHYKAACRAMAVHCDNRIKPLVKALRGIDEFAWTMVSLPEPARRNLQKKIDAVRAALKGEVR